MAREPGKIIDKIEFRHERTVYTLVLRMVRKDRSRHFSEKTQYLINVRDHVHDAEKKYVEGEDMDAVIAEARELIVTHISLDWTKVLHVEVSHGAVDPAKRPRITDSSVSLNFTPYQIATRPDGRAVHVETQDGKPRNGYGIKNGKLDEGRIEREWGRQTFITRAVVPDTEENRAALLELFRAFFALEQKLHALFMPDAIASTLTTLLADGARLLAAPPAKKRRAKR